MDIGTSCYEAFNRKRALVILGVYWYNFDLQELNRTDSEHLDLLGYVVLIFDSITANFFVIALFIGCLEDDASIESEGSLEGQRTRGGWSYLNLIFLLLR